jgi:tetratricopeptide (TPR) repeat protein
MSNTLPATAAEIAALATAADLPAAARLEAAAGILARGVPEGRALDRAMDRLAAAGLARPRRTDAPRIWAAYGAELARADRVEAAAGALDLAIALAPELVEARLDRATLAFREADLETAQRHFEAAAAEAPGSLAAHEGLAAVAARAGDLVAARRHAAAALAIDPGSHAATLALARADLADGAADRALARSAAALAKAPPPAVFIPLADLAADAADALDRPTEAFAWWAERNRLLAASLPPLPVGLERPSARAARIATWLEGQPPLRGPLPAAPSDAPVFLLGFPRSGTTLLEKALAGHGLVRTLEEVDILERIAAPLVVPGALEALPRLAPTAADAARKAWRAGAATALGPGPLPPVIIDKMPLSTVLLPAIAQIWPGARVLLAVRDPRDVVLSCFRRRFRLNPAMAEFLALDSAARFYDAVQRIAAARDRLPLSVHVVRHEALVADFEAELHGTLRFLGLDWDEDVRNFAARAAARAVTPSDIQLRKGLSADGIGAWRRYAAELAPVRPLLDGWADRLGYPPD